MLLASCALLSAQTPQPPVPPAGGPGAGAQQPQSPAGAGAAPAPEKPALPPGVLARVNGRDIQVEDYVSYLYASLGKSRLDELVDRLLIEEEAKALGITMPQEKVEAAVEEKLERTIRGLYQGSRNAFLESLTRRRTNLDEYKAKLRQDLYYEGLTSDIILRSRQVADADLQKQFDRTFGEGGVQPIIRHILIATRAAGTPGDASRPEGGAVRSNAEAKERAEKVLKELQGGADFAQLVKQYSDDAFTKKNDGRIPQYRKGFYGDTFHAAVLALTPERPLSGLLESPRGFHIVQLIERQTTRFEDVKAELEKTLRSQPPTAAERRDLSARLRAKAKLEGL